MELEAKSAPVMPDVLNHVPVHASSIFFFHFSFPGTTISETVLGHVLIQLLHIKYGLDEECQCLRKKCGELFLFGVNGGRSCESFSFICCCRELNSFFACPVSTSQLTRAIGQQLSFFFFSPFMTCFS